MRQLSVITLVTLVMAAQAFGAAGVATDPPDIRLPIGQSLPAAFDLSDYNTAGAGGPTDIAGSAAVGVRTEDFTVDGQTVSSTVKVSSALVQNGPAIDQVGSPGGNPFINVLRPGVAKQSVQALVGLPGGGGGVSPNGGTPGGATGPAWSVTFGTAAASYDGGLRVRTSTLLGGAPAGLTASIGADGSYTLTATDAFEGPVLVTFISGAGSDMDGATVLAAKELSVGANYADNDATRVVQAPADDKVQQLYSPVTVGTGEVTVSIDCTPAAAGVQVALAALDSGYSDLAYVNPTGSVQAGQTIKMSVTFAPPSGVVIPLIQAFGGSATFSNLKVFKAPAVTDLAIGANEVPLTTGLFSTTGPAIDGNFNSVTGVGALSAGQANATNDPPPSTDVSLSTENNFGASGQSVALGEAGDAFDNIALVCAPSVPGTLSARIWAKGSPTTMNFVMMVLDSGTFTPMTAIGLQKGGAMANWTPLAMTGQVLGGDLVWVVIQAVGGGNGGVLVDDMKVMQVMDLDEYFDATLYGLE
jgi:hypothetical protein